MLISMTGHGDARESAPQLTVSVELRAVNHRHFKMSLRGGESAFAYESQIEALLRPVIRRGSVLVGLRLDRSIAGGEFQIRTEVIAAYRAQLQQAFGAAESGEVPLAAFLGLPGVIPEMEGIANRSEQDWQVIAVAMSRAIEELQAMRRAEGQAMEADLRVNCEGVLSEVEAIAGRAPEVVAAFRERMLERVTRFLADRDVAIQAHDVIREVALFCERCDISEEIVRLRSHVTQFLEALKDDEPVGRKLDFLTQEMFRETNTIGSKANDAEISRGVVEMKNRVERIREMIQNVE